MSGLWASVESLDTVSSRITGTLRELAQLDAASTEELAELREMMQRQLKERATATYDQFIETEEDRATWAKVDATLEAKAQAAASALEAVDKMVGRLDRDLEDLLNQINADRAGLGLEPLSAGTLVLPDISTFLPPPPDSAPGGPAPDLGGPPLVLREDPPGMGNADPHGEPLWCYCQKPNAGEMVGCDGPGCKREWFHLHCAGLREAPEGDWFCRDCKDKPGKPKRGGGHR